MLTTIGYLGVAEPCDDVSGELGDGEALSPVSIQRVLQQDQNLLPHLHTQQTISQLTELPIA